MVIALLLNFIVDFLAMLVSIFPTVGVKNIPFIGQFVYTYWTLAVGYMNTAVSIIPMFVIVWHTFLYVIIPFEFALLIAKVFFGSRLPTNG